MSGELLPWRSWDLKILSWMFVPSCEQFSNLDRVSYLSRKSVETRKQICYPILYLILKLTLLLNMATPTLDMSFSTMNFV